MRDMTEALDVSIVMPCLNEAATVGPCVKRAMEALEILSKTHGLTGEVIVADNGSTDGSQALATAEGARVVDIDERGYGAALHGGFNAARGRFYVMGDSDCSYDFVECVPMVEKLMEGAPMCMGSRFKGEIKPGAMPWKNRYIGNPVLSGILRVLFGTHISDSHCGLRAITAETFESLRLSSSGMEFASEMVLKAALLKLDIAEVPVTLSPDGRDRPPHLHPWRDGLRHMFYMLMLSPTWLFIVPAVFLGTIGGGILTLLVANQGETMVRFGAFGIGDHWAIVASAALILAVQIAVFGMAALLQSFREGFRRPDGWTETALKYSRLQYWMMTGGALITAGFVWAAIITGGWLSSDAGPLNEIRGLISATTLMVIGTQVFFGGFLLSIIAGNRSRHGIVTD